VEVRGKRESDENGDESRGWNMRQSIAQRIERKEMKEDS
jgi:hypothetical protein